ncbi:hypothetical protein [Microbacterium sp. NPDC096154]|uniref:AAA family ATPase n=1 Tax=Microbacterium sp. NPDC096154 TaxID=3155549 RepID=UPI00331D8948
MVTNVVLATGSSTVRDYLASILAEVEAFELGAVVPDAKAAIAALERAPETGLVVVDAAADDGHGHALARTVGMAAPLVGIVMLVEEATPAAFAAAMDIGARSVVAVGASLDEVVARFEAVARWSTSARAAIEADFVGGRGGRVVAVAGAKGGVGASVLSLLLGAVSVGRRSVTVVDFDLDGGDLAPYAGIHTRRSLIDLAEVSGEITGRMLRETSYDVPGGLRLLPAPNDPERGEEMTPTAARAIVSALRFESELAILDVGSSLDEARASVLEHVDAVLLVATPDLPALRAARRTLAQWERLAVREPAGVDLVLNRRSRQDLVTAQLVERVVERPVSFVVPDGADAFENAMNTATLLESSTGVHRALAQVGDRLAGRNTETAAVADVAGADDGHEIDRLLTRATAKRTGRRMRRPRAQAHTESGQAAVELPAIMALGLLVLLLCGQALFWAGGLVAARSAAEDGARVIGLARGYDATVEQRAREVALDGLHDLWRDGSQVAVTPDSVSVRVRTPTVIPGVGLEASSSANVYREQG